MDDPTNLVDAEVKKVMDDLVDQVVKKQTFVPMDGMKCTTPEWNLHMATWELEQTAWEEAQYRADQERIRADAVRGLCELEDLLKDRALTHEKLLPHLKYDVHLDQRYDNKSVQPFITNVFEMWIDFYGVRKFSGRYSLTDQFDRWDGQLRVAIELLMDKHRERIECVWRGFWVILNVILAIESTDVQQFEDPMAYKKNLHPFTKEEKYKIYDKLGGTDGLEKFLPYFKLGWAKGIPLFLTPHQHGERLNGKVTSGQLDTPLYLCPMTKYPNFHFRGSYNVGRCSQFERGLSDKWGVHSRTASGKRNKGRRMCMLNAMYEMLIGPIPGNKKLVQHPRCHAKKGQCCIYPGCQILVMRKGAKRGRNDTIL